MAELDFVLEMAAKDDPETWEFNRPGNDNVSKPAIMASWSSRLSGLALIKILRATGREKADQNVKAWQARQHRKMIPPGMTKGGKKVDDVGDKV